MACSDRDIQPIVIIVGTRPEGIKMVPVYRALKRVGLPVLFCSTMQHDELLSQVLDLFAVRPDFDLKVMRQGQDLFYLTQSILQKTKDVFRRVQPSMVLVQGDTTSTMAAALSAFYCGIPVGHVEAGLRTDDIRSPFPEEMNRRVVGTVADFHFAPTAHAAAQLLAQGVDRSKVFCTGNTVVDALRIIKDTIESGAVSINPAIEQAVVQCKKQNKKIMLLTAHRRESFSGGIVRILESTKEFLTKHPTVFCFYPFHPNPHVIQAIEEVGLSRLPNICLTEPLAYKELAYLLLHLDWVLTDSGGIQEEAVSLGKPVLVLREKTERAEGVWAGLATMVGTDKKKIMDNLNALLAGDCTENTGNVSVYGDGYAADKIVHIIKGVIKQGSVATESSPIMFHASTKKKQEIDVKKVAVLGLGYIGLPTSIVIAEAGFAVLGFDIDESRVNAINAGDPVIQEPELFEKLQIVRGAGTFRASTVLEAADYFIIAVPTPFKNEKKADLSFVFSAADSIAAVLKKGDVVLLESTVPVGATKSLAEYLNKVTGLSAGSDFFVAHCPERVLPGKIFYELINNMRIIGGINQESVRKAKELYEVFVEGSLYLTDSTMAEMVKLVENSSRDVEIAFAHQVASMAASVGLNPYEVVELANKHPRVNVLQPSCGVGGHCLAVDPWFLVESFPQESMLLKKAREVNDSRPREVFSCIQDAVVNWKRNNTGTCTVLTLGLTYKPNVDDLRESPALAVATLLSGCDDITLLIAEPHISKKKSEQLFGSRIVSVQDGIARADIIVYLVAHKRFRAIDEKLLREKVILDFCGVRHECKQPKEGEECMFWPAKSTVELSFLDQKTTVNSKKTYPGGQA